MLRQQYSLIIICAYLFPLLGFVWYLSRFLPPQNSFPVLLIGLILSMAGSLLLVILFSKSNEFHDKNLGEIPTNSEEFTSDLSPSNDLQSNSPIHETTKHQIEKSLLSQTINEKELTIENLLKEKAVHLQQIERLNEILSETQRIAESEKIKTETIQNEYLNTCHEHRQALEQKQQQIIALENKLHSLSYNLKPILNWSEMTQKGLSEIAEAYAKINPVQSTTEIDDDSFEEKNDDSNHLLQMNLNENQSIKINGNLQLKRMLDLAEKFTGASYLTQDKPKLASSYALDLRRFCDRLQSEQSSLIFLFSISENKMLYANNKTKDILGWSSEKFIQDFYQLIGDKQKLWYEGLNNLATKNVHQFDLPIKTKAGFEVAMQCHLGLIPTGIFKDHLMGILQIS